MVDLRRLRRARRRGTGGTSTSLARWWDTPTEIAAYATGQTDVPDAWRRRLSLMLASEMLGNQPEAVRKQRPP